MPANTYGRQVVVPLTNKSGGGVIAGDVVVIDTTNNDAFTTNAAGAFTGVVGIAQDTIANNGTGRVLLSGYAALVNVNASVTRGNYGKTYTVAKQATDGGATRVLGTFCQFLTGGTTPDAHLFGMPDAAASGAGNYTSAVIWTSGTSMPGSPATNQRITRTDLGLDFYYDGTRWVSVKLYRDTFGVAAVLTPISGTNNVGYLTPWSTTYDLWLDSFDTSTFVATTSNGTDFWTIAARKQVAAGTATTLASFTTAADAANVWVRRNTAIGAVYVAATYFVLDLTATKSASAGNLYWAGSLRYRLIGV